MQRLLMQTPLASSVAVQAHTEFYGGDLALGRDRSGLRTPPIPEGFLRSRDVVIGTLKAGDLALYNQQVLHCGSANESPDRVRRQFYVSFKDKSVRNLDGTPVAARASMRPAFQNKLTLGDIRTELRALEGQEARVVKGGGAGLFGDLDLIDAAEVRAPAVVEDTEA